MNEQSATTTSSTETISIEAALQTGWNVFKAHPATLLVPAGALVGLQLGAALVKEVLPYALALLLNLSFSVLQLFVTVTLISISIRLVRGEHISWKEAYTELFESIDSVQLVWKYFLASFVSGLLTAIGFIFFFFPGLYLALRFMFVPFAVVDEELGVGAALSRSSVLTKGIKLKLLVFGIIGLVLTGIAMIPFFLGLLVVAPVLALASVHLYDQMKTARPQA